MIMARKRTSKRRFYVVCLRNDGYAAALEPRKIYRAVADAAAEAEKCIRVIDESGEDYVYPQHFFAAIALPADIERALAKAG